MMASKSDFQEMAKAQAGALVLTASMEPGRNHVGATTIAEYLSAVLATLWEDQYGNVSGKRIWGNSDWRDPVYRALITSGLLKGSFEGDGEEDPEAYIVDYDTQAAEEMIRWALGALGRQWL